MMARKRVERRCRLVTAIIAFASLVFMVGEGSGNTQGRQGPLRSSTAMVEAKRYLVNAKPVLGLPRPAKPRPVKADGKLIWEIILNGP